MNNQRANITSALLSIIKPFDWLPIFQIDLSLLDILTSRISDEKSKSLSVINKVDGLNDQTLQPSYWVMSYTKLGAILEQRLGWTAQCEGSVWDLFPKQ